MTNRIVCVRCDGPRSSACTVPVVVHGNAVVLTRRQHQILTLVSLGYADKLIARQLNIAASTVKDHAHAACRAIGGSNRAAACTMAVRLGVI